MNISSLLTEEVILHTPWPSLVAINALNEKVKQLKTANEKLLAYLHEDVTVQGRPRSTKKCAPRIFRVCRKPKNQGQADRDKIIQSFCSTVLGVDCGPEDIQRIIEQVAVTLQGQGSNALDGRSTVAIGDTCCEGIGDSKDQGKRRKLIRHYQWIKRNRKGHG